MARWVISVSDGRLYSRNGVDDELSFELAAFVRGEVGMKEWPLPKMLESLTSLGHACWTSPDGQRWVVLCNFTDLYSNPL